MRDLLGKRDELVAGDVAAGLLAGPFLEDLEEGTIADLHAQDVQGHRAPEVHRAVEEALRPGIADRQIPEVGGLGREELVVEEVEDLLLGREPFVGAPTSTRRRWQTLR